MRGRQRLASVIGHAMGAVVVWEVGRRLPGGWVPRSPWWYFVPVAMAVVPDLDTVVAMVVKSAAHIAHRGGSHSILAAVLIAACASGIVRLAHSPPSFGRAFPVLLGCALVHPLLDYLMAGGPPVPFLWPFISRGWLSPVQLIPTAFYARTPGGLIAVVLHPGTVAGIALEVLSLGPLWMAARGSQILPRPAWLLISACGFLLTYLLYAWMHGARVR
jgi:membrane-bound metal-dependent hydrolase YbcI (DUF457 family)